MEDVKNNTYTYLDEKTSQLITLDMFTGEVVSDNLPTTLQCRTPYSIPLAQAIYNYTRIGLSLNKISMKKGMPSVSLMYQWANMYPDFKHNLQQARLDRGHTFHDKIIDITADLHETSNLVDKNELMALKAVTENYKWLAEKGNPSAYGNKTTISGDSANPITFSVVDTGIRRQPIIVENEAKESNVIEHNQDRVRSSEASDDTAQPLQKV